MKYFSSIVDGMIKLMMPILIIALIRIARLVLDLRSVYGTQTIAAAFDMIVTTRLSITLVIKAVCHWAG